MISYLSKKCKAFACINGNIVKIKKGYICEEGILKKIYSAGNIVTYNVDTNISYKEEVDADASVLNPSTFTPTKSGYTFVGWREDKTASSSVLTSKVMGDNPITLYAVFRKAITLTTRISGASSTQTGYQYYNNGNIVNPTFTVANPTKSGWSFLGWSVSSSSTTVSYSTISNRAFSANTTVYAVFKVPDSAITPADISVDFNNNLSRASTTYIDGTKYSTIQIVATVIAKEQYDQNSATCGIAVNGVKYDLGRIPWESTSISVNRSFSLANSNSQQISLYISSASCLIAQVGCVFSSCKLTGRTVVG